MEERQEHRELPEGLRPVGPGDVTPDQHRTMLRNVFNFTRLKNQGVEPGVTATQVRKCMELIERGVPVSLNGPMSCFLEVDGWYGNEHVRKLFAAYVRAGYIELNSAPTGVVLPLEAAINHNHLDFFRAAMECGADERLVPTANNRVRYHGCWEEADDEDKPYELNDIHDLIADEVTRPEIQAAMVAVLRETSMNRRIQQFSSETGAPAPGAASNGRAEASPRRRRASL
jgi:hypothetical protein